MLRRQVIFSARPAGYFVPSIHLRFHDSIKALFRNRDKGYSIMLIWRLCDFDYRLTPYPLYLFDASASNGWTLAPS
jgi:hypothetical protein